MKHVVAALMGALTLYAISPAALAASSADDLRRQVVRFGDLDLTRPAGAQELNRRLKNAARNVCESYDRLGYDRSCVDQAIARAIAAVGAPLLTSRQELLAPRQPVQAQQARLAL
jgi:UrcA family protein